MTFVSHWILLFSVSLIAVDNFNGEKLRINFIEREKINSKDIKLKHDKNVYTIIIVMNKNKA